MVAKKVGTGKPAPKKKATVKKTMEPVALSDNGLATPSSTELTAQIAAKFKAGDRVQTNQDGIGIVEAEAKKGEPSVRVSFRDGEEIKTVDVFAIHLKHLDIKEVFRTDDHVFHETYGHGVIACSGIDMHGRYQVNFDKYKNAEDEDVKTTDVGYEELRLVMTAKDFAKQKKQSKKQGAEEIVRFDSIPLLAPFIFKGQAHIKVGNTSAIPAKVQVIDEGPFVMLATPMNPYANGKKVRLQKAAKVATYVDSMADVFAAAT